MTNMNEERREQLKMVDNHIIPLKFGKKQIITIEVEIKKI